MPKVWLWHHKNANVNTPAFVVILNYKCIHICDTKLYVYTSPQKSPIYPQKSPTYSQKSPTSAFMVMLNYNCIHIWNPHI